MTLPVSQIVAAPLSKRGIVAVRGADRVAFLQGLVSQDIEKVSPTSASYGALLTPQGKYLHEFCIVARNDEILLDCERDRAADLVSRLKRFRLRAKVELEDLSGSLQLLGVFNADNTASVPDHLGLPNEPGAAKRLEDGNAIAYVDPRLRALGCRVITGNAAGFASDRGLTLVDEQDYHHLRLTLGVADGTGELELEKSTLLEGNFDALNGVDWNKGCYMGQELTARTHYRGLVKRRLLPIRFNGPPLATGTQIMAGNTHVGDVLSAADGVGLARMRLDAIQTNGETAELAAGEIKIIVSIPDWLRPIALPTPA